MFPFTPHTTLRPDYCSGGSLQLDKQCLPGQFDCSWLPKIRLNIDAVKVITLGFTVV